MSTFSCIALHPPYALASRAERRRSEARARQTSKARAKKSSEARARQTTEARALEKIFEAHARQTTLACASASRPLGPSPHITNSLDPFSPDSHDSSSFSFRITNSLDLSPLLHFE
jgi:hypothetical protein